MSKRKDVPLNFAKLTDLQQMREAVHVFRKQNAPVKTEEQILGKRPRQAQDPLADKSGVAEHFNSAQSSITNHFKQTTAEPPATSIKTNREAKLESKTLDYLPKLQNK